MVRRIEVPYTGFSQQFGDEKEELLAIVAATLEKGDYILGQAVRDFEDRVSELCQVRSAVGVASGTDALVLALKALEIGEGDEVVTVANSWISTASCIALVGAKPVFVDIRDDLNIDPGLIESVINAKTKAIIPVHLTGRPAAMSEITALAAKHGLYVIEDAAQAVGAKYKGVSVGGLGDIGCFSLHPLKNLNACGDGGIVTCSDAKWVDRLRLLRNHGLIDRDHVEMWGHCSRLDTLQAAILLSRLERLSVIEQARRDNAAFYNDRLAEYVGVPHSGEGEHHVYHTYIIQTDRRDELSGYLKERGISAKVHYPVPIHLQKAAEYLGYRRGDLPKTEELGDRILTLPVHQFLTEEQKEHVVDSIASFFTDC
jgi:dTDP-4-amino-4,6-dideoxygalactose transaminase